MPEIEVKQPTEDELNDLDIAGWSAWGCDVSTFDWEYPADERAYIKTGKVIVHTATGNTTVRAGDLVLFPKGMKCTWEVLEPIQKVYRFE